jgi:hypothetical protein
LDVDVVMRSDPSLTRLALIVAIPLLVFPFVWGVPHFVSPGDCVRVARPGETRELEIVYGRFDGPAEAEALAEHARAIGYRDTTAGPDGCGRWKVVNSAVDSYTGGADAVAEGARAGLPGRLELAQG